MMNSITLIGICVEVAPCSIKLEVDNEIFDVFFNDDDDVSGIIEGKMTKIVGKLGFIDFPFPVVIAKQVFQINDNYSLSNIN